MTATDFPESNIKFGPPADLEPSQCRSIRAFAGEITQGSVEGSPIIVTAWRPDARELAAINAGAPIFVSFMARGLPPHVLTTAFAEAINLA